MKYAWATIRHKWFVFLAALKVRLPLWRVLVHDLSKFSRSELLHYNRQFFGDKDDPKGFAKAWLHHQNTNLHHWEWWITRSDHSHGGSGAVDGCLEMPTIYVKELIADWMGASKAYTGSWNMEEWLSKNLYKMCLHPQTQSQILEQLWSLGYRFDTGVWNPK